MLGSGNRREDSQRAIHAHLPYVRFGRDVGPRLPLQALGSALEHLPYQTWREFEMGVLGSEHDRHRIEPRYTRSAPVFICVVPVSAESEARAAVGRSHIALLLASAALVPSPSLSVTYLREGTGVQRFIGPLERDAMIYSEQTVHCTIDQPLAGRLQRVAQLLFQSVPALDAPEIRFALDALSNAALVTLTPAEDAAICAVALEELVMANERKNLTSTFGARVGVLLESDPARAEQAEALARAIYAARSDFVHGRYEGDDTLLEDKSRSPRALLGRAVLCALAATMSGLLRPDAVGELGLLLDQAGATPDLRARLHQFVPL